MRTQLAWTWSVPGSPASLTASPAVVEEPATRGGSGRKSRASSATFGPRSCSSKMCPGSGAPACESCWPTLPASGSMRSGICSSRPRRAPHIDDSACSLLPTPTATDFDNNIGGGQGRIGPVRLSLSSMARKGLLPTPLASQRYSGADRMGLPELARRGLLPTPTVCGDYNRAGSSPTSGDGLATVMGGPLNPQFREWLMGFPVGWTDIVSRATPSSGSRRRSRGAS